MSNSRQFIPNNHISHERNHPKEYSLVEIVYTDGSTSSFMVNAGLGITKYLRDELKEHNSLILRNDTDTLIVVREQLRSISLRQITQETP